MSRRVNFSRAYKPSEDIVARDIQGELIIIPIVSGIGDSEEEIFSLNETGRAIWDKLDGKKTLKIISNDLAIEFNAPLEEIKKDVTGLAQELLKRKMIVEVKKE